jgi:hypothetical protein
MPQETGQTFSFDQIDRVDNVAKQAGTQEPNQYDLTKYGAAYINTIASAPLPTSKAPTKAVPSGGASDALLARLAPNPNAQRKAVPMDPCKSSYANGAETRPPNGGFDQPSEGHGTLNIANGNADDAAVILAGNASQVPDRLVYIRGGMSAAMNRIPTGTYRLMFQIGRAWDNEAEMFNCAIATGVFDQMAAFEEHQTTDGVEYTEIAITLHKFVGGNARTSSLPQSQFHRHRNAP